MPNMITATGITKSYGPKRVLDGVSLSIAPGQIVALVRTKRKWQEHAAACRIVAGTA